MSKWLNDEQLLEEYKGKFIVCNIFKDEFYDVNYEWFTIGKLYEIVDTYGNSLDFAVCVIDDEGDEHWIGYESLKDRNTCFTVVEFK